MSVTIQAELVTFKPDVEPFTLVVAEETFTMVAGAEDWTEEVDDDG